MVFLIIRGSQKGDFPYLWLLSTEHKEEASKDIGKKPRICVLQALVRRVRDVPLRLAE